MFLFEFDDWTDQIVSQKIDVNSVSFCQFHPITYSFNEKFITTTKPDSLHTLLYPGNLLKLCAFYFPNENYRNKCNIFSKFQIHNIQVIKIMPEARQHRLQLNTEEKK